jgi:cyclophilin family peptidyl-prolyl cis-trans isomerase
VGTVKRERQKANRQLRLEELQKQQQRARTKRNALRITLAVVGLTVLLIVVAFLVSGGDNKNNVSAGDNTSTTASTGVTTETTAATGATTATTGTPPSTVAGATIKGDTPCPAADGSSPRTITFEKAPPMCIDLEKKYTAAIDYEGFGVLKVDLDPKKAPNTVNNFVVLARYHYFDGTVCHRAIPQFVVQCGDPTGSGSGGPGYEFADELPQKGEYQVGSLAMANSGPNTNGSQFFVITGPNGAALPPNYTLFGQTQNSAEQTDLIGNLDLAGNPDQAANGVPPLQQIAINSVHITES